MLFLLFDILEYVRSTIAPHCLSPSVGFLLVRQESKMRKNEERTRRPANVNVMRKKQRLEYYQKNTNTSIRQYKVLRATSLILVRIENVRFQSI